MRIVGRVSFSFLSLLIFFLSGCEQNTRSSAGAADVAIRNARISTVDTQTPWAQSLAIKGDRIAWVGDEKSGASRVGPSTRVVDAGGRLLLPGFIDSHFHVLLGGNPDVLRIENANSLGEIQREVREFARTRPELRWIEVEGWNYSAFPGGTR